MINAKKNWRDFGQVCFLKSAKPSSHEMKKEINSSIPHWHTSNIAYHMIVTISDSAITLYQITVHNFSTSSSKESLLIALFFVTERQL